MSKIIRQLYKCFDCGYEALFRYRAQFKCPFCHKNMSYMTAVVEDD